MSALRPFYLAGRPYGRSESIRVMNKSTGVLFAEVAAGGPDDFDAAIGAAVRGFEATRRLPGHQRECILRAICDGLARRRAELVEAMIAEVGKPRKFAEAEVGRAIDVFAEAARRATDVHGETVALDSAPRGVGYRGLWRRFPIGPVGAITPFNFPLNLAAHKIAPAIAAGCPFVLKPASATPVSTLLLGEVIAATDWPAEGWSIVPGRGEVAERLATDARVRVLTFTGSAEVGWKLRAMAGRKRVVLELGGNAACIVHEDADLADAASRCAVGGFAQAGQSCISAQRLLVHRPIYDDFRSRLVAAAGAMVVGDPQRPDVDVGPMISESDAKRVEQWVAEAVAGGARLLCGGRREGAMYWPTVLENAKRDDRVNRCEIFGPVVTLTPYDSFEQALATANDTEFGLQAGVFTRDAGRAWQAFDALEVGGVIINDGPTFRADNMPYGGVKASGLGREGVRWAMEDYMEIKMLVMRMNPGMH